MKRKADETAIQEGGGAAVTTDPTGPVSKKRRRSKAEEQTDRIGTSEKTQVTGLATRTKEGAKNISSGGEPNGAAAEAASELLKKKRNRKKTKPPPVVETNGGGDDDKPGVGGEEGEGSTKKKKAKKDKQSKKTGASSQLEGGEAGEDGEEDEGEDGTPGSGEKQKKKHRFIVFIGNLPFTATTESLRAHLAALQPSDIRLLTHLDDASKTRGHAFVEFDSYGPMTACLERYHHSEFDDGISPPRKINVELTYVFH